MTEASTHSPATGSIRNASPAVGLAAALFTILSWASAFPLIRIALRELEPLELASARFAIAALIASAFLALQGIRRPSPADAGRFLLCGLIGIALYNGFLNMGQRTVTAGAASFIINTVPIMTALLATIVLRERIRAVGWIGTAIGFAGVGMIASGQPGGVGFGGGTSLVLAAALCQAAYFMIQRPLVTRYGALASTAVTLLAGALFLAPWLPGPVAQAALGQLSAVTLGAVVALGVVPAALGYATWSCAIGVFGPVRASNMLYLVPPLATIMAVPMTGEAPGPATIAGGLAAIAGVALVNARGRS